MTPQAFQRWLADPARRPLVMGVLNVTPDSFSDGGRFESPRTVADEAERMAGAGADLLDIGGESTRPGSQPVEAAEQIRRTVPTIEAIAARKIPVTLSIDTTRADVAQAALDAGAAMLNDISAGRDDRRMFPLAAARRVPLILMHMQGKPATMHLHPHYQDVLAEVSTFLGDACQSAISAGIEANQLLIDPGMGFGKNVEHDLTLLRGLEALTAIGRPMVLGVSRKRFIGTVTQEPIASERIFGTAACVAWGVTHGAAIVRVHDVRAMAQTLAMLEAIRWGKMEPAQ